MKDYHNRNQNLKKKFKLLGKTSREIQKKGIEINKIGQTGIDLAALASSMLDLDPKLINYDILDNAITGLSSTLHYMDTDLENMTPVYNSTSASTVSIVVRSFSPEDVQFNNDNDYLYCNIYRDLEQIPDLIEDKQKAVKLMKEFGFDQSYTGMKSAIDHFQTAHDAYEGPVNKNNPVNTSLIPMRSALTEITNTLLKKRPQQEKAKNNEEKIKSIVFQVRRVGIENATIETLAKEYDGIINDLSSSKNSSIQREKWRSLLRSSTIFIQALLESIDREKLKV